MFDFLIIGGGLIGLMTARELASSGASIAIVERGQPGRESSWAAGGILSPLFPWDYTPAINQLGRWSQLAYPQLAKDLLEQTGIDPEYQISGMLITQENGLDSAIQWCEQNAVLKHPVLKSADLKSAYPNLKIQTNQALLLEHIAHIRPPRLIHALTKYLEQAGVHFLNDQTAVKITNNESAVSAITTESGQTVLAHQYILCGGAWSRELWPGDIRSIDIRPAKGQIILYPACGIELNCMYMHDHRYLIQRRDGRILVGSTLEFSGYDKRITEKAKSELMAFAAETCPALKDQEIEHHWAGLRPASPGSIPYIDQHPELENLFINAGHFRNGIILAPGSARLITDRLLKRTPIMPAGAFALTANRSQ